MKTKIVYYRNDYASKAFDSIWFRVQLRWLMRKYGFMYCCLTGGDRAVGLLITTLPESKDINCSIDAALLHKQARKWKRFLLMEIRGHMQNAVIADLKKRVGVEI